MSPRTILLLLPLLSSLLSCSSTPPAGKLIEGHLRPCPNRPNCVSSENCGSAPAAPISFRSSPEQAWQIMQTVIEGLGGKISDRGPTYLWATFSSRFCRFVDDVELRLETEGKIMHIRSGARVGYADFGVNRKRVETIRERFTEQENQPHPPAPSGTKPQQTSVGRSSPP
jgi:uncharacterized protein (DUF1499 family)